MPGGDTEISVASRKLAVVVGAGVAGCQSARALLRAGYDVLVLEQGRGLGGVWRSNYHSFGLQVPWSCYTFPEFPYAKAPAELGQRAEREGYPSGNTVKEYIAAYCAHFDVERHILYGCKVVHLGALPNSRWSLRFRHAATQSQSPELGALKIMEADLVVLATGMYYSPYVPSVPGLGAFRGSVLHARDFVSVERLRGKRVLVLGAGKSAHDCAVVAASASAGATSVTTLFRQAHWPLPRVLFGVSFHKLVYTRFAAAMMPMYYTGQGQASKRVKHTLLSPVKRLFWGALEAHVARKMQLRGALKPEIGFVQDLFFGGQIQDGVWNEAVNAGRINAVQGSLAEILPSGVRLGDGTLIECDVIVFATGYTKDYSLFDAATAARLMSACSGSEGLHLYRSIMSPWVPNLYFIGCEASSFNNVLTSGLQSLWMMHHLLGRINLPSTTELMKDIQDQRTWRRSVMPSQHYCSSSIMLYQQRYHDQLVADMGHNARRKRVMRRGSECFGVYTSEDYSELFGDAAVPGLAAAVAAVAPPRSAGEVLAVAVTLMPAAAAIGARLDLAVLPGGASGDGLDAGGAASRRRAVLLPVGANHGGAAAVAMQAPGLGAGGGGAAPAARDAASGLASAFVGSFDSPKPVEAARPAQVMTVKPPRFATAVPVAMSPLGLQGGGADAPEAEEAAPQEGQEGHSGPVGAVLDTVSTDARRSDPQLLPTVAACSSPYTAPGIDGAAPSAFSTSVIMTTGGSRPPPPQLPLPLAHRVRLQVLHLLNRSAGGTVLQAKSGAEEILEFRLQSQGALSGRVPESSIAANSQAATGISSSLCCDAIRHAAPNMYHEMVGTLEVH